MTIELIRVEDSEVMGWGEWAWAHAKERPYLAALAAPIAVVAAPFIATSVASVGLATAGAAVTAGAGEMIFGPSAPLPVTTYSVADAEGMIDAHGESLARGVTYMRHPRQSENAVIINSTRFHDYIISEKVAEIIHYMRSETRLKSIDIFIRSSDSKYAVVGGRLKVVPVKVEAGVKQHHARHMNATYGDPSRIAHKREYIWMDDFPEVVAATNKARRGTMSFSQSTDMSFGLSGNAAKIAQFEAGWLSTFVMEVEAAFA